MNNTGHTWGVGWCVAMRHNVMVSCHVSYRGYKVVKHYFSHSIVKGLISFFVLSSCFYFLSCLYKIYFDLKRLPNESDMKQK